MKFKHIIPLMLGALLLTACGAEEPSEKSPKPIDIPSVTTTASGISTTAASTNIAEISEPPKKTDAVLTSVTTTIEAIQPTVGETMAPENNSDTNDNNVEPDRQLSDGTETEQDDYLTDPVPADMPMPVEPQDAEINEEKKLTCTMSIDCLTILENIDALDEDKVDILPNDGYILPPVEVEFSEGESVFDVLKRVCMDKKIHMEFSWTPVYNSAYIEGIGNLYEFDCGALSGWMYSVNGWFPNYGCSRYQLVDGEVVEWRYTCDLGNDIGGGYSTGGT